MVSDRDNFFLSGSHPIKLVSRISGLPLFLDIVICPLVGFARVRSCRFTRADWRFAQRMTPEAQALSPGAKRPNGILQSERVFRLLVEGVRDYAIFLLDPSGNIASWNPGAERIKGYSAAEIIGKHFSIFYPESDKNA